jgi:hypothetical protein
VQFEGRIMGFRPDIAVFQFHRTDFEDNIRSGLFALSDDGRLEQHADSYMPGVAISDRLLAIPPYRWLDAHSQLFSALRQHLTAIAKNLLTALRSPAGEDGRGGAAQQEPVAKRLEDGPAALASALLERSLKTAKQAGVEWYLFEIPEHMAGPAYSSLMNRLDLSPQLEARVASPLETFRAQDKRAMYVPHGHGHLSKAGNAFGAALLASRIAEHRAGKLADCRIAATNSSG